MNKMKSISDGLPPHVHGRIPLISESDVPHLSLGLHLIVLTVVLEGAFRKWLWPESAGILLAFRDLASIAVIANAIFAGVLRKHRLLFQLLLLWTVIVLVWGLLQLMLLQSSIIVYLIGIRFWILYLWLAAIVAVSIRKNQFVILCRSWLLILLAMTPLVILQNVLPPSHLINMQPDGSVEKVFRLSGDIVRVTGTFTFTVGFACFLVLVSPLALSRQFQGTQFFQSPTVNAAIYMAVLASAAVCGSRAGMIFFAIIALCNYSSCFMQKLRPEAIRSVAIELAIILFSILFLLGRSEALIYGIEDRFQSAAASEDFMERIAIIFTGEASAWEEASFLGEGLGAGANAVSVMTSGENYFSLAESEPGRVLLEMGVIGVFWTLIKVLISIVGIYRAWRILLYTGERLPILLWISAGYALLAWPISGQLSANAFAFLLLGLAGAALRIVEISAFQRRT